MNPGESLTTSWRKYDNIREYDVPTQREREKAGNMFNICVYTKCDESQHQVLQENMRDRSNM